MSGQYMNVIVLLPVPIPSYIPSEEDLLEDKEDSARRKILAARDVRLFTLLKECLVHAITLAILIIMCAANRNRMTYYQNWTIKNNFPTLYNSSSVSDGPSLYFTSYYYTQMGVLGE